MNLYLIRNKSALLLLVFISFLTSYAQSQRVFSSIGVLNSRIDRYSGYNVYDKWITRSSLSLGYESKIWHRLSYSTVFSNFTSGGKKKNNLLYHEFENYDRVYIDNYSFGINGNFYFLNKKNQFYFGIGPRLDYARSEDTYGTLFIKKFVIGVSGSIGVNFQKDNFSYGFKSNYYHRPILLKGIDGAITIRDRAFDLQLVFGYTFSKKKNEQ